VRMLQCTLAILLSFFLFGCGPVSRTIHSQLNTGAQDTVDLRKMMGFDWEGLFVFAPYSSRLGICHDLALSATECDAAKFVDVDEGHYLVVFTLGGRVTYREEVSRLITSFDVNALRKPIARPEAVFSIERTPGGGRHLVYRPRRNQRVNSDSQTTALRLPYASRLGA